MEQMPREVQEILADLEGAGYAAYAVGGCVRDSLMGRAPQDWDVTTAAPPERVLSLFAPRAIPTGLQHGTVTVVRGPARYEVTTFRRDGVYSDSRHPDQVCFTASLEEDLARRDFTINAMAMDRRGALTDPYGGQADLSAGVLRCVGDPDTRLTEDALRIMRALRFAAVLGFSIEVRTAAALHRCRALLERIAAERIRDELTKLICGPAAEAVLLAYPDVLAAFLPEIAPAVGFDQRNRHHCCDVWEHTVRALAAVPPDPILRYTMLFHDLGKPASFTLDEHGEGHFHGHGRISGDMAHEICRRLRMDRCSSERIEALVRCHDVEVPLTEKGIRRQLRRLGEEDFRGLLWVKRGDNLAQHPAYLDRQALITQLEDLLAVVLEEEQCFSLRQLAVNGRDLLALGLKGRAVGEMLNELLDQVVEGRLPNDRALLLRYAEERRT